jgi:hypothetical protein
MLDLLLHSARQFAGAIVLLLRERPANVAVSRQTIAVLID